MEANYAFTEEEMAVNEHLGYPEDYVKLCRARSSGPYSLGPPSPSRAMLCNQMRNAGFDPAEIRVDPYGNVLYFHADSASPLARDIDHWFPVDTLSTDKESTRFRIKHNKLEFLIPWWDFQLVVSVNQFLSFFASSNSNVTRRAFPFLFSEGKNKEINPSQLVNGLSFPHHFIKSREKLGLAPAAIVVSRRESSSCDSSSILKSLDQNTWLWFHRPAIASRKVKALKENENPHQGRSTFQEIVMAQDSLKQKEAEKLQ